jgi:hypothetical protein
MEKPDFTEEQEMWLCQVIGDWYLIWKKRITDGEHRLGYAKEELKSMICGINSHTIGTNGLVAGFLEPKEFMEHYAHWDCMVCRQRRPDKFISVITHPRDDDGVAFINVKYCNDRDECICDANIKEIWKDWPPKNDHDRHRKPGD